MSNLLVYTPTALVLIPNNRHVALFLIWMPNQTMLLAPSIQFLLHMTKQQVLHKLQGYVQAVDSQYIHHFHCKRGTVSLIETMN